MEDDPNIADKCKLLRHNEKLFAWSPAFNRE